MPSTARTAPTVRLIRPPPLIGKCFSRPRTLRIGSPWPVGPPLACSMVGALIAAPQGNSSPSARSCPVSVLGAAVAAQDAAGVGTATGGRLGLVRRRGGGDGRVAAVLPEREVGRQRLTCQDGVRRGLAEHLGGVPVGHLDLLGADAGGVVRGADLEQRWLPLVALGDVQRA